MVVEKLRSGQDRVYEIEAQATWFARLDDGVVQDVMRGLAQTLEAYGAQNVYVEIRELHRAE